MFVSGTWPLLLQDVGDIIGAIFTQLLIQGSTAGC
jgi:hypothetical protein